MRRAIKRIGQGTWLLQDQVGTVTLCFDDRHRRRIRLTDDMGEAFLLDLPEAEYMNHGDGLELLAGGVIQVLAADEAVVDIMCKDAAHAAKVAWHIGNRHVPLQVLENGGLRIRKDHVLADMVRRLGAAVEDRKAAFSPEPGAYTAGGHGAHDH